MNTKEAFDRLAKRGVVVEGMEFVGSLSTERILLKQGDFGWAQATEEHAVMLLEAAWHRKFPNWVIDKYRDAGLCAWEHDDENWEPVVDGIPSATTALEAMVLAAEAKESP